MAAGRHIPPLDAVGPLLAYARYARTFSVMGNEHQEPYVLVSQRGTDCCEIGGQGSNVRTVSPSRSLCHVRACVIT